MKWLQSKKCFQDIVKYNEKSGEFEIVNRNSPDVPENLDGSYEILGGVFVVLYINDQELYVGVGSNSFQMGNGLEISVKNDADNRLMTLTKNGAVLSTVQYKILSENKFAGDTTAFIDDEDFDYGLFLSNISKDKGRQKVLLGTD